MAEKMYTVIGDLVASRDVPDRASVQGAVNESLDAVNCHLAPAQLFEPTIGDEFQGACGTLADAVLAALVVRLMLLPVVDSRCGIGFGEFAVHDASRRPLLQDGPGWWAAREAIVALGRGKPLRRTWYVGHDSSTVNAFLICRDQIVERLNDRGARMLTLALLGHSQKDIAQSEAVWPSAVSQQFARGVGAVMDAQALFARRKEL
jgi:hypothetical protein